MENNQLNQANVETSISSAPFSMDDLSAVRNHSVWLNLFIIVKKDVNAIQACLLSVPNKLA